MYDAGLQLFWYRPLFMIELLVSVLLFTLNLRKKEHFALRAGLCIAVLLALAFAVPIVYQNAAWGSVLFLSMLVAVIFAMKVCFAESWWNVLFCGIAAYSVRHIAYTVFISINQLFFSLTNAALEVDPYNKPIMAVPGRYMFIIVSIYLVCYFVVYWIGYFLYAGRIRRSEDLNLGYSRIVLFSGAIILIDIVLSLVTEYNAQIDVTSLVVERLYNLLSCVLALQLLFGQLRQKEMNNELAAVNRLRIEQQKMYEMTKENIDTINIKCHDLKHQLRAYREKGKLDASELEEMEKAVSIYQSSVKTGSEELDVILMDKCLYCERNGITLTCIADGEKLGFMRSGDIYALFGNAIDNAIEAVLRLPKEKRVIAFSVKAVASTVMVHIENYFDGELKMKNGIPQTGKKNTAEHGFGMLSMRTIAEKYGGRMETEIVKDVFNLNFLFVRG